MKILLLADTLSSSAGWGSFSSSMLKGLKNRGHEVWHLCADGTTEINLPKTNAGRWAWIFGGWRLKKWIRKHEIDLIYIPVEPYARLFKNFNHVPFVLTMHGTYVEPRAHGGEWAAKTFSKAQHNAAWLTVASAFTFGFLPDDLKSKTTVIPHGIDESLANEPYSEIAYDKGRPLIVSVGAIKPRKGFDKLIEGFSEFTKTNEKAQLVIVGKIIHEKYHEPLVRLVKDLNLEGKVTFTDQVMQEQLLGWYRTCDVFALTSVTRGGFEGFGLVYLEANLFGKPSVGNRESGAVSAIEDGVSGYLVDAENPQDIASALRKSLVLDRAKVLDFAKNNTWNERIKTYNEIFKRCAKV